MSFLSIVLADALFQLKIMKKKDCLFLSDAPYVFSTSIPLSLHLKIIRLCINVHLNVGK